MTKQDKLTAWHQRALRNYDQAWSGSMDVREKINEATRFALIPGAQWEGSTDGGYDIGGKFEKYPRFELNKVAKECTRIIGEYRKNRITAKFRPKDSQASEDLAQKLNGKFRADMQESDGEEALDNAFSDAVYGGFGCFRLEAGWEDELDLENERQKITIHPVYDPALSVWFDQDSKNYDRSDATWAVEMFSLSPDAFREKYPKANLSTMDKQTTGTQYDWNTPEAVYIARYYEVKTEQTTLVAYVNPLTKERAVYDLEQIEEIQDELLEGGFVELNSRKVNQRRVYCGLMSGAEWLEEPVRIPGEHIPLIPVYGNRHFVDNQERIEGHVAKAMDAQRLENLMVSMMADNATQASGDNIPIVDVDMLPSGLANAWAERNTRRPAFLPIRSLKDKNGNIIAASQVVGNTGVTQMSPALAAMVQYTSGAIQQITGSQDLGNIPSNIATDTVDTIFNRMDTQSFVYMDNMAKSLKRCGIVWLSMAREVYGSDIPLRIINEDGSDDMQELKGEVVDRQSGKVIALNDLSIGKYEVISDVGQSFQTRRDKTVSQLTEILRITPPTDPKFPILLAFLLDNMDGEGIDDLKAFNRKQLLMQQVVKPRTSEEEQMVMQAMQAAQSQPDPNMVIAQAEMQKAQADMVNAQTRSNDTQISAFKAQQEAQLKQAQTIKTMAEAEHISEKRVKEAIALIEEFNRRQQMPTHPQQEPATSGFFNT